MKAQAVLGQFPGAATGRDAADLVAMAPFSGPYLTLVFPQSKWGTNNGDYATDFRAFNRKPGQWTFEVRADTAVSRWSCAGKVTGTGPSLPSRAAHVASSPNPPPLSRQSESRLVTVVNRKTNLQGNQCHQPAFLQNIRLRASRSESEINRLGFVHRGRCRRLWRRRGTARWRSKPVAWTRGTTRRCLITKISVK